MAQTEPWCLDGEEWRDIAGFEDLYQVSDKGRVRSKTRRVRFGNRWRVAEGRILKQSTDAYGYNIVILSNGAKCRKTSKVHRLVAQAFIPNPENLDVVDHIDCNKQNNDVSNLRWCTSAQNTRYAYENGLIHQTEESIRKLVERSSKPVVRDDGEIYPSVRAAARANGVTDNAIHHVLHERKYHRVCKGHTFSYA